MGILSQITQNLPAMWKSSSTSQEVEREEGSSSNSNSSHGLWGRERGEGLWEPSSLKRRGGDAVASQEPVTPRSTFSEEDRFFTPPTSPLLSPLILRDRVKTFGKNEEEEIEEYSSNDPTDVNVAAVRQKIMVERYHGFAAARLMFEENTFGSPPQSSIVPGSHAVISSTSETNLSRVPSTEPSPDYQEFLEELSQLQSQEVGPETRDILAFDRQTYQYQSIEEQDMADHRHVPASSAVEKFPDWVDDTEVPYDFTVAMDMGRSRANTYEPLFLPEIRKCRSMSHAEFAAEIMDNETLDEVHETLTAWPAPPSLAEARTRRETLKNNRRAIFNELIRPHTKNRALEILARPKRSFVSEAQYIHLTGNARDVLDQIEELDNRARAREVELFRRRYYRQQRQVKEAADLEEINARLGEINRGWENGEQVRGVKPVRYEEEENSEVAESLAILEGRSDGSRAF